MTRKRISDLLREEAGNADSKVQAAPIEAAPIEVAPIEAEVKAVAPDKPVSTAPNLLEAELKTELEALKAALDAAQKDAIAQASELAKAQDQIASLKSELSKTKGYQKEIDSQKELISKLYGELQKENPLQSEFNNQKTLIESLYVEIEQLKQAPGAQAAIAIASPSPTAAIAKVRPTTQQSALSKLPAYHPIPRPIGKTLPGQSKKAAIDNDVIGWFD
jgi:DNA repair exonuclease SbcCD ATPase subunit